ncbi:MAG TPA: hypothetical protein VG498_22250 [Terriglobales bacterium]|nr:hypothetical protein [Terriglobales bacterium]
MQNQLLRLSDFMTKGRNGPNILEVRCCADDSSLHCASSCAVHATAIATSASKRDHTLAIVDPVTLQVIARAPVGADPHAVIASLDGKTAYVSIYGGGRYHTLSVVDVVGQRALPKSIQEP